MDVTWHRKAEGHYFADVEGYGTIDVTRRSPDRRHGVLPWEVVSSREPGRRIAQAETKGEAQRLAERYAHRH
jgi:hypothetical protein